MDQPLLTVVLLVVVGVVTYQFAAWRTARNEKLRRAAEVENNRSEAQTDSPKNVDSTPAKTASDPPNPVAVAVPPAEITATPSAEGPSLDHIAYDEDVDDEIELTKIGEQASAPPPQRTIHQPPLKKIVIDEGAESEEDLDSKSVFFLVSATAQTDRGLRRKQNEDSLCVLERMNLFSVADGMGGYAGGELASRLAVQTIADAFRDGTFDGPAHEDVSIEATNLARAIQMSNAAILEEVAKNKELSGMGTTVVAAIFSPNKRRLHIGHVGDSRCYRLRDGSFTQITADHTMGEFGIKGPEAQALSRAVGIWPTVPIDILMAVPRTGDVYLLCSDGLTKMLPDHLIANVLKHEQDPKVAVERLVFFANSRGGKDNISVVLVRVVPPDWRPEPSEPFSLASNFPPPSAQAEEEEPPNTVPPKLRSPH